MHYDTIIDVTYDRITALSLDAVKMKADYSEMIARREVRLSEYKAERDAVLAELELAIVKQVLHDNKVDY